MTFSRSFSNKTARLLLAGVLLGLAGCAGMQTARPKEAGAGLRVAVLPVLNLSGAAAPLKELRQELIAGLTARGIAVLDDAALESFMERHELRYTGGIRTETSQAFKTETGTDAVLIASLDFYSDRPPPKAALSARLVSTGDQRILWMDGRGSAGDDSPGLLGLGRVTDVNRLMERNARLLVNSLADSLAGTGTPPGAARRFRPRTSFRSAVFSTDRHYRVAVVPFINESRRAGAADVMGLRFVNALAQSRNFQVIDPGVVREKLLRFRIVFDHGVSLANADVLFEILDADLILTGTVFEYEDYQGGYGKPKVSFSVQMIEKKSREVVWSSRSLNEGDQGVFFFNVGRISTAQAMASQMASATVEMMERN